MNYTAPIRNDYETMKLGIDQIKNKFNDIESKIDFMIEYCSTLESKNRDLQLKITELEAKIDTKNKTEEQFSEQKVLVRSKIDDLLKKLDTFSSRVNPAGASNDELT